VLARKPGALRNGAPFKDWLLPASLERVRRKLKGSDDGDRQMVKVLSAVADHGALCPSGAADRAAGLHSRRPGCRSPARPADAADRGAVAELVDGPGRHRPAGDARVALVVAVTIVAEVGDFRRFANARQLMAYLGLVPSEHSSGASVRRSGITKAGNVLARRVLIEGAWTYRMPARVSSRRFSRRRRVSSSRSALVAPS